MSVNNRRSGQIAATGDVLSTLRVRNPDTGVVYHLVFEGNLSKLTGAQLKQHLEGICLISAEQQQLRFKGEIVENFSTGEMMGIRDKDMLELRVQSEESHSGVSRRGAHIATAAADPSSHNNSKNNIPKSGLAREGPRVNATSESLYRGDRRTSRGGLPFEAIPPLQRQQQQQQHQQEAQYPQRQPQRRHQQEEGRFQLQHHHGLNDTKDCSLSQATSALRPISKGYVLGPSVSPAPCEWDPVEVIIEEDTIGDLNAAMTPVHSLDLELDRLEQKEYLWMMEQMRFGMERMNRERELLRQRQILAFDAEMLERERCDLGRRTLLERRKFLVLQDWIREEVATEARLYGNMDDNGVHHGIYMGDEDSFNRSTGDGDERVTSYL